MIVFLVCGVVGLVFLMITIFSGHDGDASSMDHDFSHDSVGHDSGRSSGQASVSVFSVRTVVTFLIAFGAIGAICDYYGMGMLASTFIGAVAGIVFVFVSWWLMNFATKQQASSIVNTSDMLGKIGIVHTSIPKNGIGEIAVELGGQRKYVSARAQDSTVAIPENAQVKVLSSSSGVVIVELSTSS